MAEDRYEIVRIPEETVRLPQIIDLMDHFWKDEPICVICGLKRDSFMELFVAAIVSEGASIMAIDTHTIQMLLLVFVLA